MTYALLLAAALCACGKLQKPVNFVTTASVDSALETVSQVLTEAGHRARKVGRQSNVVQTEWEDSGVKHEPIKGQPSTVVRRFVVTLTPSTAGVNVALRMDGKRCTAAESGSSAKHGPCAELNVMPEKLQQELDRLGKLLDEALPP